MSIIKFFGFIGVCALGIAFWVMVGRFIWAIFFGPAAAGF